MLMRWRFVGCWTWAVTLSMMRKCPGPRRKTEHEWISDVLGRIFGWTSGATIGTFFTIAKRGEHVGTDEFGNRYYLSRDRSSYDGRRRRWVTYNGYADAS